MSIIPVNNKDYDVSSHHDFSRVFPNEILILIFSEISDIFSLLSLRLVCVHFNPLIKSESLGKLLQNKVEKEVEIQPILQNIIDAFRRETFPLFENESLPYLFCLVKAQRYCVNLICSDLLKNQFKEHQISKALSLRKEENTLHLFSNFADKIISIETGNNMQIISILFNYGFRKHAFKLINRCERRSILWEELPYIHRYIGILKHLLEDYGPKEIDPEVFKGFFYRAVGEGCQEAVDYLLQNALMSKVSEKDLNDAFDYAVCNIRNIRALYPIHTLQSLLLHSRAKEIYQEPLLRLLNMESYNENFFNLRMIKNLLAIHPAFEKHENLVNLCKCIVLSEDSKSKFELLKFILEESSKKKSVTYEDKVLFFSLACSRGWETYIEYFLGLKKEGEETYVISSQEILRNLYDSSHRLNFQVFKYISPEKLESRAKEFSLNDLLRFFDSVTAFNRQTSENTFIELMKNVSKFPQFKKVPDRTIQKAFFRAVKGKYLEIIKFFLIEFSKSISEEELKKIILKLENHRDNVSIKEYLSEHLILFYGD